MGQEDTAAEEVQEGKAAFRLAEQTPVYEAAGSGEVIALLPAGSLVTVHAQVGAFLQVVTPQDKFGYIAAETPVHPVEPPVTHPPDKSAEAPAQELFQRQLQAGATGAAAVAPDGRRAPQREDESFRLAEPPSPHERLLIYDRIGANRRSTLVLLALFVLFLAAFFTAIGLFIVAYGGADPIANIGTSIGIAVVGALIALVIGVIMYFSATAAVISISEAHQVSKQKEPDLYRIVENLSIGSGLPMPKVWVMEDSAPNAFATGRNPDNSHVAATRGLLDKLQKRELEAVMAHEMSHVGNYDTRIMTMVAVGVGLIALVSDLMLRFTWYGAGSRSSNRDRGGGAIALLILVVALIFIIISPLVAGIIRLALSRH